MQDRLEQFIKSTTNHTPSSNQIKRIEDVRHSAQLLATLIINNTNHSRQTSLAPTRLEDAVMWAVKAVVLEER